MFYDTTEYLNIGSTPHDEECIGVGSPDYYTKGKDEVYRFARQIEKHYPPVQGARIKVKRFEHDFGTYYEACVVYETGNAEAEEYALRVEADEKGVLQKWDKDVE